MADRKLLRSGGSIPFGVHQVVEMLVAAVLLLEGARTGQDTAVLVGLGIALLLLALMSDGVAGAWPWIGRRTHRVLDLVFAGVLALSPLVLSLDHVLPIILVEATAVGLVWLSFSTNWSSKASRRRRADPPPAAPTASREPSPSPSAGAPAPSVAPPAPAPAPASAPAPDPTPSPAPSPEPSRAQQLGETVGRATADGPRRLGRAVGRARARAKRPPPPP